MTRKTKNIFMLLLVILLVVINYFTIDYANNNGSKMPMNMENNNGTLPDMNNNMKEEPPEKPSNENISSNTSEMPEKNNNMGEPPSKPNGDNNMTPPNQNGMSNINDKNNNSALYYILFIIEDLGISLIISYLIMSNFNKNTFKRTFKSSGRIKGYLLITIILTCGLVYLDNYFMNNNDSNFDNKNINGEFNNNISSDAKGEKEIEDSQELTDEYETNNSDTSVLLVKNGGNLTLKDATVTKSSGDSTNTENSEFYGINAGILVTSNSTATIKNSKISTNAQGSNAVFSTGTNSKIYISDSVITTTGSSSARGLDATYGGYIEADNVEITTQGGSCATLATDRGEGTVIATNSKLVTNGTRSPIIYSTGNISITNTTGTANGSQMVVIEGKNSATIIDSTLDASGKGNRGDVDQSGIMIYQSMSGDASEGTGTNSNLTIQSDSTYYKTAPMFFITNTDAVINLENTKLNYGSNILISAKGTSEWGTSESNGGKLVLNATNQTLNGDIVIDKISTLNMILKSSSYKGTINEDNTAQSITLKLDKSSKITLTGNSYITSLDNEDSTNSNIDFNGYKLFVNGDSIN